MKPEYGAKLKHMFGWGSDVVGAKNLFFHAYTRIADCDPSIPEDLTRAELEGRAQLRRIGDARVGVEEKPLRAYHIGTPAEHVL